MFMCIICIWVSVQFSSTMHIHTHIIVQNEAIAEWNSFGDVPASCADSWFCDVIVKTTVQTVYCKTMEFILRKRICVKVLDDKQIDNYTSFITGYGGRKIGTKCGALFDISPKDTKVAIIMVAIATYICIC